MVKSPHQQVLLFVIASQNIYRDLCLFAYFEINCIQTAWQIIFQLWRICTNIEESERMEIH